MEIKGYEIWQDEWLEKHRKYVKDNNAEWKSNHSPVIIETRVDVKLHSVVITATKSESNPSGGDIKKECK